MGSECLGMLLICDRCRSIQKVKRCRVTSVVCTALLKQLGEILNGRVKVEKLCVKVTKIIAKQSIAKESTLTFKHLPDAFV